MLYLLCGYSIQDFLRYELLILRQLDLNSIKEPIEVSKEYVLDENCENLANVFHTAFLEGKGRKLSMKVSVALGIDLSLGLELTKDRRVLLKAFERGLELWPPMIPDGVYKVLAILLALEFNPKMLVIDELENSLHASALEFITHELKNSDCIVIAATHSPVVVDLADPEDLILVEKNEEGASIYRRIKNPDKIKEQLREMGITLSERWLYGKL